MKIRFILFFVVLASLSACVKAPSYPLIPAITFTSVSSTIIKSGGVDTITFAFTDGDGDIGVNNAVADSCGLCSTDSCVYKMRNFNVFLRDSRDNCVAFFASANVESGSRFPGIEGEILVIQAIDSKKCFVPPVVGCPLDTLVYTIVLRDMAGNYSNEIQTVPIFVDGE